MIGRSWTLSRLACLVLLLHAAAAWAGWEEPADRALEAPVLQAWERGDHAAGVEASRALAEYRQRELGPDHPDTLFAWTAHGFFLLGAGRFAEAPPVMRPVLEARQRAGDLDNADAVLAATILATALESLDQYREAEPLYRLVLDWRRRRLGPDHPETGQAMARLAWTLDALGRHAESRPFYEGALAVAEAHSPDPAADPEVATALTNLAHLDATQGLLEQALTRQRRVVAILEAAGGPEGTTGPAVANALNNLANTLENLARYQEALPLMERALRLHRESGQPDNPQMLATLNNLASLRLEMGEHAEAQALLEQSLAERERLFGRNHPETALALMNLAALHDRLGALEKSKPLYEDALLRLEAALGPEHPRLADFLANLGVAANRLGDRDRARRLQERALAIRRQALGEAHPDIALSLHNLGMISFAQRRWDEAAALFRQALDVTVAALGPRHPAAANSINSLCGTLHSSQRYAEAEQVCAQALAIRKETLGERHLDTLTTMNNLAALWQDMDRRDEAEALLRQTLDGMGALLGPEHPYVGIARANLAKSLANGGHWEGAAREFLAAQVVDSLQARRVLGVTVEAEQLAFLKTLEESLHVFLSLTMAMPTRDAAMDRAACDIWLQRKGLTLEAQKRFQEALLSSADPAVHQALRDLAMLRGRISALAWAGPGGLSPEAHQARLQALQAEKEALEQRIAKDFAPLARQRQRAGADSDLLARLLPADAALVEFCRYHAYRFGPGGLADRWQAPRYLAFVLRPGQAPALVDLGEAEAIESLTRRLRQGVMQAGDPAAREAIQAGRALHDRLFAPLRPALGEAASIFLSPDGALNLIPFEILVDEQGKFLIESRRFHYLSAGRDLAAPTAGPVSANPPLLLGDPAFDSPSASVPEPAAGPPAQGARSLSPPSGLRFSPLPGAREEVRSLAALMPGAAILLGDEATEAALRAHPRPRILHLATHGFFLEDAAAADEPAGGEPGAASRIVAMRDAVAAPSSSALLRAGLALAGANAIAASPPGAPGGEGLLTAEKVLSLDLNGVALATLSACDTGTGEAHAGEGVFGLRRAFLQAGARRLVMSLWSVPDAETAELMQTMYRLHLEEGVPPAQALRQAALRQLELARRRLGVAHPFYWGAFILVGEP